MHFVGPYSHHMSAIPISIDKDKPEMEINNFLNMNIFQEFTRPGGFGGR